MAACPQHVSWWKVGSSARQPNVCPKTHDDVTSVVHMTKTERLELGQCNVLQLSFQRNEPAMAIWVRLEGVYQGGSLVCQRQEPLENKQYLFLGNKTMSVVSCIQPHQTLDE